MRASGRDPATLPSVFTSAHGDLAVNDYMSSTLATQPTAISPTRFHNSVHNAAAGYWTIATGCHAASSAADRVRRAALPPACSRRRPSARPTIARCCWSRFDVQAVGALASVTRSVGLLAAALVIAPTGASGGTDGPSFAATLVSGPTRRRRRDRRRRARSPATRWPMPCRSSRRSRSAASGALDLPLSRTLALRLAPAA